VSGSIRPDPGTRAAKAREPPTPKLAAAAFRRRFPRSWCRALRAPTVGFSRCSGEASRSSSSAASGERSSGAPATRRPRDDRQGLDLRPRHRRRGLPNSDHAGPFYSRLIHPREPASAELRATVKLRRAAAAIGWPALSQPAQARDMFSPPAR
jgi:hypothetical protein